MANAICRDSYTFFFMASENGDPFDLVGDDLLKPSTSTEVCDVLWEFEQNHKFAHPARKRID